jgi:signal transduction histidine kinase
MEDDRVYLTVEDNGLGIDLEKYGQKVFGMYQTFHSHDTAQGIGLFITRNQVEAMGGNIYIESAVDVGTKFTIMLV